MLNRLAAVLIAGGVLAAVGCEPSGGSERESDDVAAEAVADTGADAVADSAADTAADTVACDSPVGADASPGCVKGTLPLTYVSHSVEGHALKIDVTYPGGCGRHDFAVWWDGGTLTSDPGIAQLQLHHYTCGEHCDQTVADTITIDLSALDQYANPAPDILRVEVFAAAGPRLMDIFDYSEPTTPGTLPDDAVAIIQECGGIITP